MSVEIKSATMIVEAGTARFIETLAPPPRSAGDSGPEVEAARAFDRVIALGSSVLAPGLSTPLGR